jgi:hypothetical protein
MKLALLTAKDYLKRIESLYLLEDMPKLYPSVTIKSTNWFIWASLSGIFVVVIITIVGNLKFLSRYTRKIFI